MKIIYVTVLSLIVILSQVSQADITGSNLQLTDEINTVAASDPLLDWADPVWSSGSQWEDRSVGQTEEAFVSAVDPVLGAIDKSYEGRLQRSSYELLTTISGLTSGDVYHVWIINTIRNPVQDTRDIFGIMGAFDGDPLVEYLSSNPASVDTGLISHAAGSTSEWLVYETHLGLTIVDVNGEIKVSIAPVNNTIDRSVYHGLAYEVVDTPYCQNPPEMDFTGPDGAKDCIVNIYDFADFSASWMTTCSPAQQPIVFNDNGAWCWFQDERVIIHDGQLIIGSLADNAGTDGSSRGGNIEVVSYDIAAGGPPIRTVLNSSFAGDDHNSPAFLVLPDNKILTMYTGHSSDNYVRYRISTNPNDTSAWTSEQTFYHSAVVCYSNLFQLSDESGRIYNFFRGANNYGSGRNPNYIYSDDNGQTFTYGGQLLRSDGMYPYLKYASNYTDKIHFVTTEGHPQNQYPHCSIYHGYIDQGSVYKTDGTFIRDLATGPVLPTDLTKVFAGDYDNNAWTADLHLDQNGYPYIGYTVQIDDNKYDHRYRYARWDGAQWHDYEIAYAGTCLYEAQEDYTGLIALDPQDPDRVYISTDAHPYTGEPLISQADGERHYEIFVGTTEDFGASWLWETITKDSTVDNLRPIVPIWDGQQTALLWMQGRYGSYTDYDLDIVGLFDPQPVVGDCTHDFDGDYVVDVADLLIFVQSWLDCGLVPTCQ